MGPDELISVQGSENGSLQAYKRLFVPINLSSVRVSGYSAPRRGVIT
jgi:hypothetical protein